MMRKIGRPAVIALAVLALAAPGKPALAELGGLLNLNGDSGVASDPAKQPGLELNSYSWERGDWGPGGRESKVRYGRVAVPDKGPGVLAVVTPAAMKDNPLRALCGKTTPIKEIGLRSPNIEDYAQPTYRMFKLTDVTVSDCVHADGAPGEVFRLSFAEIKELGP